MCLECTVIIIQAMRALNAQNILQKFKVTDNQFLRQAGKHRRGVHYGSLGKHETVSKSLTLPDFSRLFPSVLIAVFDPYGAPAPSQTHPIENRFMTMRCRTVPDESLHRS